MLTPLDLKLLRDIGKMKGQMVSVSVVMACGLAMMIMARSLILSLESTRDAYYTEHRFAVFWRKECGWAGALRSGAHRKVHVKYHFDIRVN